MGYFDAFLSISFKTTEDGRKLFFPWGIHRPGYTIPTEEDFKRLRRHVKGYMIISLILMIGADTWMGLLGVVAVLPILIVLYETWGRYQCRHLLEADDKLTLSEGFADQVRMHSTVGLWLLEVGALAFVGSGVFILVVDPNNWLLTTVSIVFFGFCAVVFAWALITKKRETRARQ